MNEKTFKIKPILSVFSLNDSVMKIGEARTLNDIANKLSTAKLNRYYDPFSLKCHFYSSNEGSSEWKNTYIITADRLDEKTGKVKAYEQGIYFSDGQISWSSETK